MTADDDLINTMLKKYITKHYKLYKITRLFPLLKERKTSFELFDYEKQTSISELVVTNYLEKIFSTGVIEIKRALNEIVSEETDRLRRLQTNMDL